MGRSITQFNLPITDKRVETAVSAASVASSNTDFEHDSMEVMEKPVGRYLGLIACSASFRRPILVKMFSGGGGGGCSGWGEAEPSGMPFPFD